MEYNELLKIYRDQINTIDKELIYLLARRFQIVNEIGLIKKENNISVLQKEIFEKLLTDHIAV